MNFIAFFGAALIPLLLGFVWYHPKVFGTAWMKAAGVDPESGKSMNMALVFGLTYVLAVLVAFALFSITIHQTALFSLFADEPGFREKAADSEAWQTFTALMAKYGDRFRTFKHGAFHGTLAGIAMALPVIAVNAMFERKGFKYVAINAGYWIVSLALMGGVICQWGLGKEL